jgi:hypothetical protein
MNSHQQDQVTAMLKTIQIVVGIVLAAGIAALLLVTICGCAPNVVYVPTPVPCVRPEVPERPHWAIEDFTGKESYGDIIRGFGASLNAERGYSESLEVLIEGIK